MEHKWKPKKKIKTLSLRLSFSTRPLSQSRCTSEDRERLQQQLAEKESTSPHEKSLLRFKGFEWNCVTAPVPPPCNRKIKCFFSQANYFHKRFSKRELSHRLQIQIGAYFAKLLQPLNITSCWIKASLLYAPVAAHRLRRVCTCGAAVANYSNGDLKGNIWQSVAAASGLVFRSRFSVFTEMKHCGVCKGTSRWLPTSRNTSGSSCGTDSTPVWAEETC